jgi:hypothetical protein
MLGNLDLRPYVKYSCQQNVFHENRRLLDRFCKEIARKI